MRRLWLLVTALVALASPMASGQPAPVTLDVTAHDDGQTFWFSIVGYAGHNPTVRVAEGTNVTVQFHNAGTSQHNFHLRTGGGIPCCIPVGHNATATFTMPAGDVEYYCEPHGTLGMHGVLAQPDSTLSTGSPATGGAKGRTGSSAGAPAAGLPLLLVALTIVGVAIRRRR